MRREIDGRRTLYPCTRVVVYQCLLYRTVWKKTAGIYFRRDFAGTNDKQYRIRFRLFRTRKQIRMDILCIFSLRQWPKSASSVVGHGFRHFGIISLRWLGVVNNDCIRNDINSYVNFTGVYIPYHTRFNCISVIVSR